MNNKDIYFISACEMLQKIKSQEASSLEITEKYIERIEKINPLINAYCTKTFDLARKMAKEADNKIRNNKKVGGLVGLPISIKDLNYTKGIRTTFGSKIFEHCIPEEDGIVVKRLKEAGCVILGKTNTPEFGHAGSTHNLVFGETKNPWDLNKTSGGSSGGAAAGIAAGLSVLALGSDGGGSIRIPSCFCGVFGIKPNLGRVPTYPLKNNDKPSILSCNGPIVRYVKDAALMLDVIKGYYPKDILALPNDDIKYLDQIEQYPKKLKIGYSLNLGHAKQVDSEVEKNVLSAINKFEQMNWEIEEFKVKLRRPEFTFNVIYTVGYANGLKSYLAKWKDKMEPDLIKMIEAGLTYTGVDIEKAMRKRYDLFLKVQQLFQEYDILITPTTAVPAFNLGIMGPTQINGKKVSPTGWTPFSFPFNLTGHPAASVPCGWSNEGLPIGMQIVGKRFDELSVLQVSKAFEELSPWQEKNPSLSKIGQK